MQVHIGQRIKDVLYQRRMKVSEFAEAINRSRNVVYNIFTRATIDTGLLYKIGEVLDHDFFKYYTSFEDDIVFQDEQGRYLTRENMREKISGLERRLDQCYEKLTQAKREIALLRKVNELLEKRGI